MVVNIDEILRYLGYRENIADEETLKQIEACINEIQNMQAGSCTYKIFEVEALESEIILKGTVVSLRGRDIASHLKGSKKCALMAATLGVEVDRRIAYYTKFDISNAVIMDACASAMIEALCNEIQVNIEQIAKEAGFNITDRFSPGYGDLSLEHQKGILRVLNAERILGLTLTESLILIPRKSVTAIIGFKENAKNHNIDKCKKCSMKNCKFRKAGVICE